MSLTSYQAAPPRVLRIDYAGTNKQKQTEKKTAAKYAKGHEIKTLTEKFWLQR